MAGYQGKYLPLTRHLESLDRGEVTLTFAEVEAILGFALPASARAHQAWWANPRTDAHPYAHAWLDAGWEVHGPDLARERVTLRRVLAPATR